MTPLAGVRSPVTAGLNPFRSDQVQPGARPFLFAPDEGNLEDLVRRFDTLDRRAQLLGRHGSGKSTLLHALATRFVEDGRSIRVIQLRAGQRGLPAGALAGVPAGGTVLLDGAEQLPWPRWWWVRLLTRVRRLGLLATAHHDRGLPTLLTTHVDTGRALRLVEVLLAASPGSGLSAPAPDEMERLLSAAGGNLRTVLGWLYDCAAGRQARATRGQ